MAGLLTARAVDKIIATQKNKLKTTYKILIYKF